MAFVAPGLIQGIAAGFGGDQLLQDLALRRLQVRQAQDQVQQSEEATAANKVWSKAIMDVLAGSTQNPQVQQVQSPPPGQASVPMTQPATTPASPGMATPPSPTMALLSGQTPQPMQRPTASAQPPASLQAPSSPMAQLDVSNILQKIQAENPNLPDGVLSSVVNDHILPLMSAQAQQSYKNFQDQLDLLKLDNEQQDKMNQLYFKYDQLQQTMEDRSLSRQERMMMAEAMISIKQQMVDIMKPYYNARADDAAAAAAYDKQKTDTLRTGGSLKKSTGPSMDQKINAAKEYIKGVSAQDLDAALNSQIPTGEQKYIVDQWKLSQLPLSTSGNGTTDTSGKQSSEAPSTDTGIPLSADQKDDPDGTQYTGSDGKTYVKKGDVAVPQ